MINKILNKLYEGKNISFTEAESIGNIDSANNRFPLKYCFDNEGKLGDGHFGTVYETIQENPMAIKTFYKKSTLGFIERSFYNQKKMRKKFGNIIAKPRGIFNAYCKTSKSFRIGLVMKKVPGKNLKKWMEIGNLPQSVFNEAEDIWDNMEKKGRVSNYFGIHWENVMYDPESKRFGFIDFDLDELNF